LPEIEKDLGLSHAASGSFFLFISSGYFFSILSSGFISSRLSHKKTIVASLIASGCALCILSFCSTLIQIRLALFCLGLSAGLYLPSGLAIVTTILPPAYWARGMALHELAPNVGFVTAPFIATAMLYWMSWSSGLLLLGACIILVGIFYGYIQPSVAGYGERPNFIVCKHIVSTKEFWMMVLMFSMAICATLGLYSMLPLYLVVDKNASPVEANNLVALSRVSSIIMPLIGGLLGDRYGNRRVIAYTLIISGMLTIPIGLLSGASLLFFIVVQPMIAVCFFPSAFVVLSGIVDQKSSNVAVSLCIPVAFMIGGGTIPALIGLIGDHYSLGVGIIMSGVVMSLAGLLALVFQLKS
jgi:NNP family nitrate/nitrite transporter-like MFS transporter